MTVFVKVRSRAAETTAGGFLVCGNSGDQIQFDFDAEWSAYPAKTARFRYTRNGSAQYQDVPFEGNVCEIPPMHDITELAVGVYAGDIRTTTPAFIPCATCITDGSPQHSDPAPDVYNQLMEALAELQRGR